MYNYLTILLVFFCLNLRAQSTAELDTIQKDNKVSVNLTINSNFSDSSQIEVQYFQIIDSDTNIVFDGIYDFLVKDPSSFSQLELNGQNTQIILNIGWFDPYISFAIVFISNVGQVTEQILLN